MSYYHINTTTKIILPYYHHIHTISNTTNDQFR